MATHDDGVASDHVVSPGGEMLENPRRRDYLQIAAVAWAGVGVGVVALPLINQMNPSADVLAQSTTDVDLAAIQPGQAIKTQFRKQPLFVRNLTATEIAEADAVPLNTLRDPQTLEQRTKPGKTNWLITLGVCTHLGCVPLGAVEGEYRGPYGGYFCPCHGSVYDTAARIRQGAGPEEPVRPSLHFHVGHDGNRRLRTLA